MLVGSACQCVSWVFADVHWGMSMYTGSHCVALDHNLVGLWLISLYCGFLLCMGICWRGGGRHVGGLCVVVCIAVFVLFFFCVCVLWLLFLVVYGASFYFGLCFKLFI